MSKIINFEESRGIPVAFTRVGEQHRCAHPDFEVLAATHEARCRKCCQIIHPFDVLFAFAENDRMFRFWVAKYEADKKRLWIRRNYILIKMNKAENKNA